MFDSFYAPGARDWDDFGDRYNPPKRFIHGEWHTIARYEKPARGDGQPVEVDEMRMPARFFRVRALASENSIGEPREAFTLATGSDMGELANALAKAIADGMLGLREDGDDA